jgi:hypothetical protein
MQRAGLGSLVDPEREAQTLTLIEVTTQTIRAEYGEDTDPLALVVMARAIVGAEIDPTYERALAAQLVDDQITAEPDLARFLYERLTRRY